MMDIPGGFIEVEVLVHPNSRPSSVPPGSRRLLPVSAIREFYYFEHPNGTYGPGWWARIKGEAYMLRVVEQ